MFYQRLLICVLLAAAAWSFSAAAILAADASADAVAVRVLPNPEHLSPLSWYRANIKTQGSPQTLLVDGYEAVRDGRTVYVNAANISGNDFYTNIYLLSFSQGVGQDTEDIISQLLSHWNFNAKISEERKILVRRDTKRLSDLAEIKIALNNYQKTHSGDFPALTAGSYVSGKSFSVWPSWQETLSRDLGAVLPLDPVNKFGACPGYDAVTCWDQNNKKFAGVPVGSRVYSYTYAGAKAYNLCAIMESGYLTSLAQGACPESAVGYQVSCDNNTWTPKVNPAEVCPDQTIIETNGCGQTRNQLRGTKCCDTSWTPVRNQAEVCAAETIEERSNCGTVRNTLRGAKTDGVCAPAIKTQTVACATKPDNTDWNTGATVLQTWDGSAWQPSNASAYDTTPGICKFKCAAGFNWDNGVCASGVSITCSALSAYNGTTNDAAPVIQNCINNSAAGDRVLLPAGKYYVGASITITDHPITLKTAGKTGAMPKCGLNDASCAEIVALRNLASSILYVAQSNVTIDHLIINGNKAQRNYIGANCHLNSIDSLYNINFHGTNSIITNNVSKETLCGTSLYIQGSGPLPPDGTPAQRRTTGMTVTNNTFAYNGVHDKNNYWADGITLKDGENSTFSNNEFIDNTDIDFVLGGCRNCLVQNNKITHTASFAGGAFSAMHIQAWPAPYNTSGDFTNADISGNTIDCGPEKQCGFGICIGPDPWYDPEVFGGSVHDNKITGAQQAINIDDAHDFEVYKNQVVNSGGLTYVGDVRDGSIGTMIGGSYNIGKDSRNIDTSKDGGQTAYTSADWDYKIPNWWSVPTNKTAISFENYSSFVSSMFDCILERPADASGLNHWTNQLTMHLVQPADIYGKFFSSDEYARKNVGNEKYVSQLYTCLLLREKTNSELKIWSDELTAGKTKNEILNSFLNLTEFKISVAPRLKSLNKIILGVYTGGNSGSELRGRDVSLAEFEADAGKKVGIFGKAIWWVNSAPEDSAQLNEFGDFNTKIKAWAEATYAKGITPLVMWQSFDPQINDPGLRAEQNNFPLDQQLDWDSMCYSPGVAPGCDRLLDANEPAYLTRLKKYSLKNIAQGDFDNYIRLWARQAKAYGKPLIFRMMHEMNNVADLSSPGAIPYGQSWSVIMKDADGVTLLNTPADEIAAWRHIVDIFRAEGATNVSWLWSLLSWPSVSYGGTNTISMSSIYPGDNYVDYIGVECYNFYGDWTECSSDNVKNSYKEAAALSPNRPITMAEMGSKEDAATPLRKAQWLDNALSPNNPNSMLNLYPRVNSITYWNMEGSSLMVESSEAAKQAFKNAINSPVYTK